MQMADVRHGDRKVKVFKLRGNLGSHDERLIKLIEEAVTEGKAVILDLTDPRLHSISSAKILLDAHTMCGKDRPLKVVASRRMQETIARLSGDSSFSFSNTLTEALDA